MNLFEIIMTVIIGIMGAFILWASIDTIIINWGHSSFYDDEGISDDIY